METLSFEVLIFWSPNYLATVCDCNVLVSFSLATFLKSKSTGVMILLTIHDKVELYKTEP